MKTQFSFFRLAALSSLTLFFSIVACDDNNNDAGNTVDTSSDTSKTDTDSFECAADKDGWEQCVDNKVQYCHIVEGMDPHFHWGADCATLGYACVETSASVAVCLDESSTCTADAFKCENNSAYTCVTHNGALSFAIEPCGTSATCQTNGATAYCEKNAVEDTFNPQSACDAMLAEAVETKGVVTVFDDVFSADYHAEQEIRVSVTLPDNVASYIHFPVFSCGEYAVFFHQTGVFDAILHRDGTVMTTSGGTAVSFCAENIPEHWHADLAWDGGAEKTEGADPVPYVIRFKPIPGGGTVEFTVFQIALED